MSKHTSKGYTVTFNSITVGSLTGIPVPAAARGEIDVTDLDSTGIETLPALEDGGTVDLNCFFEPDDTGQQALITNYELGDGTTQTVVIQAPAASTSQTTGPSWSFSAYCQAFSATAPVNGAVTATYTLRLSGGITYTDPA